MVVTLVTHVARTVAEEGVGRGGVEEEAEEEDAEEEAEEKAGGEEENKQKRRILHRLTKKESFSDDSDTCVCRHMTAAESIDDGDKSLFISHLIT